MKIAEFFTDPYYDGVITEENKEADPTAEPCCEEMAILLSMSNTPIEMCEDVQAYMKVVTHPDHEEIRRRIKLHTPEVCAQLKRLEVNPEMRKRWLAALYE